MKILAALLLAATAAHGEPVTFYKHLAPILYKECATCHRPGESGPFSLLTYDDAKKRASQLAKVTASRFMPPWLPAPGHAEFSEERRLTDAQIKMFADWVAQGTPAGNPGSAPSMPNFTSDWQMGQPDLVLRAARPYKMKGDDAEIFWNFVLPVPISTTRWVKAIEVRPGNPKAFHHANVLIDRGRTARRKEAVPGAGFPGMDLIFEEETFDPDGHFLSWKPGTEPVVEPEGMAWRADPGMDLILNVHLKPSGKEETVSPMIGLYFTDKPQSKYPMLVQLERDNALDIPPGEKDFVVTDEFKASMDMNVLSIYPHAHYLAKVMEVFATLPDGSKKWLVEIKDWDLNWQGVFRYKKPVFLPKDSVVTMRYHFDNSSDNPRNPHNPPQRIVGGNRADLEMSHFWLQVLPVKDGDQRAVLQESLASQRLAKSPDDFIANFNMGDLLLNKGKTPEAIEYFERASKSDPSSVLAASELGVALYSAGQLEKAEQQFRKALEIDRSYTDARFNLASVEASLGKFDASVDDFKQVLVEKPDYAKAGQRLGQVLTLWGDSLAKSGNDAQATAKYQEAVPMIADNVDLRVRLGMAFARQERLAESQAEFESALRLKPDLKLAQEAITAIKKRRAETGK